MRRDTPGTLLSEELRLSSRSTADWHSKTSVYSRSLAVMSIVGYVLGLGDRHLDNILLDFTTGQVTHIDYSVCFERGQHLRIPETVPFRLTQNLEKALGAASVHGAYKVTCERTMEVIRNRREVLLTTLTAFVSDPLLEWHPLFSESAISTIADIRTNIAALAVHKEECRTYLAALSTVNKNAKTICQSATSIVRGHVEAQRAFARREKRISEQKRLLESMKALVPSRNAAITELVNRMNVIMDAVPNRMRCV